MEIDIYTDCGGSDNDLGIGIHIIYPDESETSYMLKTNSKDVNILYNNNTNITLGEIHAVLSSLKLVDSNVKKVRIFTDSDHAFHVFNKCFKVKKKKITRELYINLNSILDEFKSKFEIELMWIKGHANVYGNEISDSITLKALKPSVKPNVMYKVGIPVKGKPVEILSII